MAHGRRGGGRGGTGLGSGEGGAPWVRLVEREGGNWGERKASGAPMRYGMNNNKGEVITNYGGSKSTTLGFAPSCDCNAGVVPCVVADPFNGSGTTGAVACSLDRDYIGIDLNSDYIELAHARIREAINASGRAPVVRVGKAADYESMPLFAEAA